MHKQARRSHVAPREPAISLRQSGRLSTANILALTTWSHSTLYARISSGRFPKPRKDGSRNYWITDEVRALLLDEPAAG